MTDRHIIGLPGPLPPGEHVLWQGAPAWRSLARHLCHLPGVATYFAILLAGTAALSTAEGATPLETAITLAPLAAAAILVLAFLVVLAWLVARSTEYTLTTHRLVMRMGIALPATLAIPHRAIAHAAVTLHRDGTGDLPITTKPAYPIRLHRIWPHARPWRLARPQPMLRSIPDAGRVATMLAQTLAHASLARAAVESHPPAPRAPAAQPQAMAALSPIH